MPSDRKDQPIWTPSNGLFSVHSAWDLFIIHKPRVTWHKLIWFKSHIPRVSTVVWMAIPGGLNTLDRLVVYGVMSSSQCVLCHH